jgi:hypothetical protein
MGWLDNFLRLYLFHSLLLVDAPFQERKPNKFKLASSDAFGRSFSANFWRLGPQFRLSCFRRLRCRPAGGPRPIGSVAIVKSIPGRILLYHDERNGPPEGGPEGSGGFARRYIGLFDFRLANDDFRAVEREIVDFHVEAPPVAVDPRCAYRLPETAFTVLGHGVNPVARAVVCLAHVMFLSSWFESRAPCAASWGTKARAEKRRVQRRPTGHREAARSWQGAEGD